MSILHSVTLLLLDSPSDLPLFFLAYGVQVVVTST